MDEHVDRQLSMLIARAQRGDQRAYEAALVEVARIVREYVRRRLGDSVDDVVQETLISVHRALHSYDPDRPFGPWLYAIARHRVTDAARRQRRWLRVEQDASACAPPVDACEPGNRHVLERALAMLSARQRQVIELLKLAEHSVEEIATEMGLSRSAVKVTAHRGVRRLRALLVAGNDD
jgi:RNA polymerase sigma-70 factor (ECF subfamily)